MFSEHVENEGIDSKNKMGALTNIKNRLYMPTFPQSMQIYTFLLKRRKKNNKKNHFLFY